MLAEQSYITIAVEAKRHTRCGGTICTLFTEHKGASTRTTTWQRNNVVAEAPYHRDTDVDTI